MKINRSFNCAIEPARRQLDAPSAPVGATLTNPWTGEPRDYRDVNSDPAGVLCVEPGAPLKSAPSAPVGVEDHGVASPGEDPKPPHTPSLRWLADREAVATQEWQDGFNAAYSYYAQQPASDGGFTAADMMDARQEGRKEAQQPAAAQENDDA